MCVSVCASVCVCVKVCKCMWEMESNCLRCEERDLERRVRDRDIDMVIMLTLASCLFSVSLLLPNRLQKAFERYILIQIHYTLFIHYTDKLHRYPIQIHCADTLYRYTVQIPYTDTLYRYTVQIHYTNTLYRYTIQIHYTDTLYRYTNNFNQWTSKS